MVRSPQAVGHQFHQTAAGEHRQQVWPPMLKQMPDAVTEKAGAFWSWRAEILLDPALVLVARTDVKIAARFGAKPSRMVVGHGGLGDVGNGPSGLQEIGAGRDVLAHQRSLPKETK